MAPREGSPSASTAEAGGTDTQIVLLLGRLLWDVFSDNHAVVDSDGIAYDLGTFRRSGAVIARVINRRYADAPARYGYLDFYLGTRLMQDRQALRPVYRWLFEQLREAGCDWEYSFPRLYVHEVRPDRTEENDPVTYDPSDAVRKELERKAREEELRRLREELEEAYREQVRRARDEPLPPLVAGYREAYGRLPEGWPHRDD